MLSQTVPTQLDIDRAFSKVKHEIECAGSSQEAGYYGHEARYRRNIARILELVPPGAVILDVGSHFLHQAAVLSELGYQVIGMDVPEFSDVDRTKSRAVKFKIQNCVVARFDHGTFLDGYESGIDLVLFSEIQEHITFNPIPFWRRIHQLLKIGGKIYLTTPNSLTLWKVASGLKKLLSLKGYGIGVEEILDRVTFGHHWKEYSAYELRQLFRALSPDFDVAITSYELRESEKWVDLKAALRDMTRRASSRFAPFREELEAVITLRSRSVWRIEAPEYF